MEEIWKNIQGYEGKYQVSNFGRIKSLGNNKTRKEKILKTIEDSKGYLTINLCKEGKHKTYKIHRLVVEAFIPNPNNYPIINHKDENPLNNCVDNLEWCTYHYNNTYGTVIKRRVENTDWKARTENTDYREIARKLSKSVIQYTKDGEFVREWSSTNECGRNGFNQGHVSSCCIGKRKSHKGFIWKYKE